MTRRIAHSPVMPSLSSTFLGGATFAGVIDMMGLEARLWIAGKTSCQKDRLFVETTVVLM